MALVGRAAGMLGFRHGRCRGLSPHVFFAGATDRRSWHLRLSEATDRASRVEVVLLTVVVVVLSSLLSAPRASACPAAGPPVAVAALPARDHRRAPPPGLCKFNSSSSTATHGPTPSLRPALSHYHRPPRLLSVVRLFLRGRAVQLSISRLGPCLLVRCLVSDSSLLSPIVGA